MAQSDKVYGYVTERIIKELESGTLPWRKPWFHSGWAMGSNGRIYSLLNQCLLDKPGYYYTWKQVDKLGGHVKPEESKKWHMVVAYFKTPNEKKGSDTDDDDDSETKFHWSFKYWQVYHQSQCEGVPMWEMPEANTDISPIEKAESVIASYIERSGVTLLNKEDSNDAWYSPTTDTIRVPRIEQYADVSEYYSTLFHESTHSTGHESRLNRFTKGSGKFGSEVYSKEELIAEIGSSMILSALGIETKESFENSAAYIAGWLSKLKDSSPRFVVNAAYAAEDAVELIMNTK